MQNISPNYTYIEHKVRPPKKNATWPSKAMHVPYFHIYSRPCRMWDLALLTFTVRPFDNDLWVMKLWHLYQGWIWTLWPEKKPRARKTENGTRGCRQNTLKMDAPPPSIILSLASPVRCILGVIWCTYIYNHPSLILQILRVNHNHIKG